MPAYDPDVVAYLYPVEEKGRTGALNTIQKLENAAHLVSARCQDDSPHLKETLDRSIREPTEQPEESDIQTSDPYLKFTFSDPPKTSLGFVAGRAPQSDLLLAKYKGVSWYHFALTFEDKNELVVKDLNSTVGTRVIYDNEDGERGHGISWSTRGPSLVKGKAPTIKIVGDLQFRIVVPAHDTSSKTYLDNVARFRLGTAPAEDLFRDLQLARVKTELATPTEGAYTPGAGTSNSIFWKKELGKGVFAVVYYAFDVTTQEEYALKEPLTERFDSKMWLKEYKLMRDISHDHIVKLKHANFENGPKLYFEYVPGGTLDQYFSVTTSYHNEKIAIQLLSGLGYLHTREVPITHRDIKPENILVQSWSSTDIFVLYADFGLSRQAEILKTYCGSLLYAAPEIYCLPRDPRYCPLVDIWSLGVLLVHLECRKLPKYPNYFRKSGTLWAETIVEFVQAYLKRHGERRLLSFVREHMLAIKAQDRRSAMQCHGTALELFEQETCEVAITSVEDASFHATTDSSALPPEEEDSEEESNPATPKAMPADATATPQDFPASIIVSLGWRGSDAVDSLLGMAPSDMSDFQRSAGVSVETARVAATLLEGNLWFEPLEEYERAGEDEATRDVTEGEDGEEGSSETSTVKQTSSPADSYSVRMLLGNLTNAGAEAIEKGQAPSKRQMVEESLSRKRIRLQESGEV